MGRRMMSVGGSAPTMLGYEMVDCMFEGNETLSDDERAELCEAIFRSFRYNDYQLLREFAFHSAVSTYLTVITRRLAVAFLSEE